jgi:hypothetical protein
MNDFFFHNTQVGRVVDREAGTWEKVVPGREYVFDSHSLRRFCARAGSGRCHCDHRWDKFKLVGSWGFSFLACGSILSGSMTGHVGCAIWVRHGSHTVTN